MTEEELIKVFVESTSYYFNHTTQEPADVQVPYLIEKEHPVIYDYTGIIGITGSRQGIVYFTATRLLVQYLLLASGEKDLSVEHCADMVGEIANTVAGNTRKVLGSDFMISVPLVVQGQPEGVRLTHRSRSFVIPLQWKNYKGAVVVSFA